MSAFAKGYGYFFNSSSGDRTYNAESFEEWLKPFFISGVFNGELQVKAQTTPDMTVKVTAGHANLDGKAATWETENTMTLAVASGVYDRIDTIVLRRDNINRTISIEVVTGTASSNPQPTAPVRDADTFELVLAQIYVGVGVTAITQSAITDTRMDSDVCGWVAATVDQIDFDQIRAQFDAWEAETQDFFTAWFENIRGQLDEDAAGHLQNEIDDFYDNLIWYTINGDTCSVNLQRYRFARLRNSTILDAGGQLLPDGIYMLRTYVTANRQITYNEISWVCDASWGADRRGLIPLMQDYYVQKYEDIVDNLTSTSTTMALSANQGKVLNDRLESFIVTERVLTVETAEGLTSHSGKTLKSLTGSYITPNIPIGYELVGNVNITVNGISGLGVFFDGDTATSMSLNPWVYNFSNGDVVIGRSVTFRLLSLCRKQ